MSKKEKYIADKRVYSFSANLHHWRQKEKSSFPILNSSHVFFPFFFLRDCILKKCFFFDFRPTNCLRILFHLPSFLSRRSRQLWELPGMSRFGSKLELPSALQNYGQEALGSLPKDLGL